VPGQAFLWAELTTITSSLSPQNGFIAVLPGAATEQHDPQLPAMTDVAIVEDMIGW